MEIYESKWLCMKLLHSCLSERNRPSGYVHYVQNLMTFFYRQLQLFGLEEIDPWSVVVQN